MKRAMDITVSLLALLLLSPVLAATALAILFEDGRPVLFRQQRVGRGGREFGMYKFRSMVKNAASIGPYFTSAADPRITRTGRFIRRTSIDELPQLLNVIRGDMSLVGPRPDVPTQRSLYSPDEWVLRCSVRPGITGWAQALLRSEATEEQRRTLDLRYAKEHSLALDLRILWWTLGRLSGKGKQLVVCGIFGYWDRGARALAQDRLDAMSSSLLHRGPDDQGVHHRPQRGVAIGNRRLSIIDIAGGHQPMLSDDGCVAVVQNGEIFNYVELADELRSQGVALRTHSDTEVILRLYEREGIACLRRLNGMFAIAIDDARDDALYLARDRIGVKPLYVMEQGDRTLFASEIKALLAASSTTPDIDLEAIHHYLTFNYIPAPWTVWDRVKHVMPGTWMKLTRGAAQVQRWWDLSQQREREQQFEPWSEEFLALLDDATRIRLRADVPWGAFLSGGVDSSTIVGLMARHVERPVKTFCIGFDDPRFDESAAAAQAAARFGCDHRMEVAELNMLERWPLVLHHLDQPHGDASFMPTLRVSELAAQHVKVVLTGDGGDELFAGYDKYAAYFGQDGIASLGDEEFRRSYFDSISLFSPAAKIDLYRPELARRLAGVDSFREAAQPWFEEAAHFDRVNQALYLDMQLLLSGNNLVKPDRMGMAVSIEARTPFLDWRMMEFAFRSPGRTKLHGADKKHWYKRAVVPLIGEELACRRKQMFTVPVGEWFRNESHDWLVALLHGSDLLDRTLRREAVDTLLRQHREGSANRTRELRALAALALWARPFGQ